MIRKILIEGVRTHEHTEIELGRLTCLVGPNGSGKSTVLQAFEALFEVLMGEEPHSWARSSTTSWRIEFENSEGSKAGIRNQPAVRRFVGQELLALFPFRLDSEVLRCASEVKAARPKLGSNGAQLALVLATWKDSGEERFQTVLDQLKQIVPTLENVRPCLTTVGEQPSLELRFDFRLARDIPARAVSEGTLLALGLLTALNGANGLKFPDRSTIVLLDDIDRGLHPDAQLELIKLLRQLAELKDLQIVMTTHSPYIVDALAPEEVCVLALDETGTTRARRLSEIPGAERYRGMLSTGELWSANGESWVLEEQAKTKAS